VFLVGAYYTSDGTNTSPAPRVTFSPTYTKISKNQTIRYTRPSKPVSHSLPQSNSSGRVEIEGFTIGDGHRSENSSTSFFTSIDRDGDGNLDRPELSNFLRKRIGGNPFNTKGKLDREIESILTRLDLDADDDLDQLDVSSYLKNNLDGLLGVEDVIEWLTHAVQLPDDVVESKFCGKGVTGYDFPELVENNGKRLETEMKITSSKHRSKIVQHINARMLGIGSSLPQVELDIDVVSCNQVVLKWKKLQTAPFPVHKYRIQRLEVKKEGVGEIGTAVEQKTRGNVAMVKDRLCNMGNYANSSVDWETLYTGNNDKHVDVTKVGYEYTYRIEAWNAVGRSSWVSVNKKEKMWSRCNKTPLDTPPEKHNMWQIYQMCVCIQRTFCFLMFVFGLMFRLQYGAGHDNCCRILTIAQNYVNRVSRYIFQVNIFPNTDQDFRYLDLGKINGATSLNLSQIPIVRKPFSDIYSIETTESPSTGSQSISTFSTNSLVREEKTNDKKAKKLVKMFKRIFKRRKIEKSTSDTSSPSFEESQENNNRSQCNSCKKKFKWNRCRRICSKCQMSFCHKHGKCTHTIGTPCPAAGNCICSKCSIQ